MPDHGKPISAPTNFDGPVRRKCTDVLFTLILIVSWAAMTYIGVQAVQKGNPDKLINGLDYKGQICGIDEEVKDKPNMYYIRYDGTGVCVESCPDTTDLNVLYACVDDESENSINGSDPLECESSDSAQCALLTKITDPDTFSGTGDGVCMYQIESIAILNRCFFIDSNIASQFSSVDDTSNIVQQALSDIYQARYYILGFGFGASFLFGFIYCIILQIPGVVSAMTWGSIVGVIGLFAGIGYLLWDKSIQWEHEDVEVHSDNQILSAKIVGVIGFVLSGLSLCLALFMYRRIRIATSIMKEAARAIGKIPLLVLMPVFEAFGILFFFVPFVYYCVHIASIGEFSTETINGTEVKTVEYNDEVQLLALYMLFCLFWTTQFILAVGQIVVALAIVKYFFTANKSKIGNRTFFKALWQGLFYHTGTAAFGSLIIAIVQAIRTVLTYVQKKARASGNKILEAVFACLQCCMWCLEKCMQFINKNAYIQTALFSTSFCTSSKEAFFLIARNIVRVGAVAMVTECMVIMMKLCICLASCGATYLILDYKMGNELYSLVAPTIFSGVLSYIVANVFAELFSMTTSTILQCFIADEEMFPDNGRHASQELRDLMDHQKIRSILADTGTAQ